MRIPAYLSPTSLELWSRSPEEYYLNYLANNRPPRMAQTLPMSIGSSFDAFVKSYLHEALFGVGNDPKFAFDAIFQAQVDPACRDWALKNGKFAFECYKKSGALADLMLELKSAIGEPKFELEVMGVVDGHREGITKKLGGVTFLGKPDVFYVSKAGTYVILDFKVNGWCSTRTTSPMAGYIRLRDILGKHSGPHKDCMAMMHQGQIINVNHYLENLDQAWARQLSIYGWLCGMAIGEEFIVAIDQIVCTPTGAEFPLPRIAEHRLRVSPLHQWRIFAEAEELWETIHSDHIFRNMNKEDSDTRCAALEKQAAVLCGQGSEDEVLFSQMTTGRQRAW